MIGKIKQKKGKYNYWRSVFSFFNLDIRSNFSERRLIVLIMSIFIPCGLSIAMYFFLNLNKHIDRGMKPTAQEIQFMQYQFVSTLFSFVFLFSSLIFLFRCFINRIEKQSIEKNKASYMLFGKGIVSLGKTLTEFIAFILCIILSLVISYVVMIINGDKIVSYVKHPNNSIIPVITSYIKHVLGLKILYSFISIIFIYLFIIVLGRFISYIGKNTKISGIISFIVIMIIVIYSIAIFFVILASTKTYEEFDSRGNFSNMVGYNPFFGLKIFSGWEFLLPWKLLPKYQLIFSFVPILNIAYPSLSFFIPDENNYYFIGPVLESIIFVLLMWKWYPKKQKIILCHLK